MRSPLPFRFRTKEDAEAFRSAFEIHGVSKLELVIDPYIAVQTEIGSEFRVNEDYTNAPYEFRLVGGDNEMTVAEKDPESEY